jgi:hypothetical protein
VTGDEGRGRGRGRDRDRLIVVDAANVVGSRPDGWWRDRAGAARRLLVKLAGLEERLAEPVEVVVVLEGAARGAITGAGQPGAKGNNAKRAGPTSGARDRGPGGTGRGAPDGGGVGLEAADLGEVRVVLAKGSGDDAIVEVVRAAAAEDSGRAITVVTADRGLRDRVEALGASTVGPRWLWDHLDG